jgi:hypothetical protein
VYGREKEFKSAKFGSQVYIFADEMQIRDLKEEVVNFFDETNKPSEVFTIFDLYVMSNNHVGLDSCKQAS